MNRISSPATPRLRGGLLAALLLAGGLALAAEPGPAGAPVAAAESVAAQGASLPAVRSADILTLQDASQQPGYAEQSNAERARVQPGNNAPNWRAVGQGVTGTVNMPYAEYGTLIQPTVQYPLVRAASAGEAWRQLRNRVLLPYGGALLLIVALALGLFYLGKGPLGEAHQPGQGEPIERFTPFERAAHWSNAAAFLTLALSGLVMAFGKFFLLPVLGSTLFGWLAYALKNLHNFVGPLYAVSLLVMIATFVKDNIANRADFQWLLRAGGMLGQGQLPSHRFNAGEKGIFWWAVTIPGLLLVASGLVLDKLVPGLDYFRADMQLAHIAHASLALLSCAMIAGHIYMGTVGVRGAYRAMKTGYVEPGWAQEHHLLWYQDIRAGKIPARRSSAARAARQP
jgi:formate dehydrogenase subunit gamma